jgi:hypothetical protein
MASDDADKPDLSFVALDDLMDELAKRFRAIVVIAEREAPIGNERSVRFIDYRGGITTCVGLAMRGQAYMLNLAEGE